MDHDVVPLFPLNIVLFPRMPLPLHIFEDRYKRMIKRCIETSSPFGVVLIREGQEVGGVPVPETVGTLAHIHAVNRMDDGRMKILTVGTERFRLLSCEVAEGDLLVGRIECFGDDHPADPDATDDVAEETSDLFGKYFRALINHAGVDLPEYDLPADADELSFVVAAVLQLSNERRQGLLEMTSTYDRLAEERAALLEQLDLIEHAPGAPEPNASPIEVKDFLAEMSRN